MNKTRYVVVHLLNDFSGSPRVLADFCSTDAVQRACLTIVTNSSKGFLHEGLGEKKKIWYPRGKLPALNLISFALAQVQIFLRIVMLGLRSWVRGENLIVINNTILSLGSMISSRCVGATSIAYVHELSNGPAITRRIAEYVIRWTAHEVIFVSEFLRDNYQRIRSDSTILPNGLRSDFDTSGSIDFESKYINGRILFVGSPKTYKGVDELLKIAFRLPNISFTAVFNCSEKELEEFVSVKKIPENLSLLNRIVSLEREFRDAFLVLNLSLPDVCVETFGLTILEGMSFACPCIVPPIGGHLDYFDDESGLMVDARDTERIVTFIDQLRSDKKLWRSYANHALEVAEGFSAKSYNSRVNTFLRRLGERDIDRTKG